MSIDIYLATNALFLKRKENENLSSGVKVYTSHHWFDEGKGKELMVSRATIEKLLHQSW